MCKILKSYACSALFLTAAAAVSSCVYEAGDSPDAPADVEYAGKSVHLSFNIYSGHDGMPSTRADECTDGVHTETPSTHPDMEDKVVFDNGHTRFYIFSGDGADALLIYDSEVTRDDANGIDYPKYTCTVIPDVGYTLHVTLPMVKKSDGTPLFEVHPDGGTTTLRLVVFANIDNITLPPLTLNQSKWSDLPEEISGTVSSAANPAFTIKGSWTPGSASADSPTYIPMYGTRDFRIPNRFLYESEIYSPVHLDDEPLSLLRALGKIEIIDAIRDRNKDGYPKIASVSFGATAATAANSKKFLLNGLLIPSGFKNGVQVTVPTMPADFKNKPWGILKSTEAKGIIDSAYTGPGEVDYWYTYCPEQKPPAQGTGTPLNLTSVIEVTIAFSTTRNVVYTLSFDGSYKSTVQSGKDPSFTPVKQILRNHIYRIAITSVSEKAELKLSYETLNLDDRVSNIPDFE